MVDPARRREQRAVLRTDFVAFYSKCFITSKPAADFHLGWHHENIAYHLERVRSGAEDRLAINVPPRSGKSMMASVAWPMFLLGHKPNLEILAISHTDSLARDFSLMRRTISEQAWYRDLFPQLVFKRTRNMDLETTLGGRIFASGVGGAVLGKGADVVILDDPQQASAATSEAERRRFNEFYDNTLVGRLNSKASSAVVLVMQRLHQDDATAHLCGSDDFVVVRLPALADENAELPLSAAVGDVHRRKAGDVLDPIREPYEALERVRRTQGAMHFQAQYQQDPAPASGNVVKRDWLRYHEQAPESFDRIIVSWDTASTLNETSDYSVGTVWGSKGLDFYLLDIVRDRFETPTLRREIIALHRRWQADLTIIEETELGRSLAQDLRAGRDLLPVLDSTRGQAKAARFLAQATRFETGQVHLPQHHPLLGAYIAEILAFPNGAHDDQVDSTSQALRNLTRVANFSTPPSRPNPPRRASNRPRPQGAPFRG